jgi:hypothetical protein
MPGSSCIGRINNNSNLALHRAGRLHISSSQEALAVLQSQMQPVRDANRLS